MNFIINQWNHFIQMNHLEMYSTHNEEESAIAEILIWTLRNGIYKYMTSILKNRNTDKLDDTVHKYSNTYHKTIKMKINQSKWFTSKLFTSK